MKPFEPFALQIVRDISSRFEAAGNATQQQAEQGMNHTAAVFLAQRPAVDRVAESRAYRATHDKLHAEALAIRREREGR